MKMKLQKKGIQGIARKDLPSMANWEDNAITRAIIPPKLCEEIADVCEGKQKVVQGVLNA